MKLTDVHIQKFRNIDDATPTTIQPDVTCLVGKNESGKTAFLEALNRLKPAFKAEFVGLDHYPRWFYSEHRKMVGVVEETVPVEATFDLDVDDVSAVEAVFGSAVLKNPKVVASRNYGNVLQVTIDGLNEKRAVVNFVEGLDVEPVLVAKLKGAATFEALTNALTEMAAQAAAAQPSELTPAEPDQTIKPSVDWGQVAQDVDAVKRLQAELLPSDRALVDVVGAILKGRLPTFFYFSQYSLLEGRVDVQKLFGDQKQLTSGEMTAHSLLELAGADSAALIAEQYESRKAELEAVANRLTREVAKYWTQSKDLDVLIDVDKETVPTPQGQTAVARYLDIRVKDRRHGYTNNFSQRSSGFRWFFSFLAAFSRFEERQDRVVILLDEPGLNLHAKAQLDFLRFIDERLAPHHQVIYTTHSPFMVQTGKLERARLVEDKGEEVGSKISSDVFSTDADTLFPLQAALGYDIAQSLFMGPDNLLVEGTSDFTYLTVLSDFLKAQGRNHLNDRWRLLPAGGATNIPTFVALLGQHLEITVLMDAGSPTQKVFDLAKQGYLASKRLITVAQVTGKKESDIEDLFEVDEYLQLYNSAFGRKLAQGDLTGSDRILGRIARKQGTFDHGLPADYLLRNRDKILPTLSAKTLDRFEKLFEIINGTLT